VRAYEEGRFRDALTAFTAAEQAAGDAASGPLLYNRALAALRAGDLRVAESSAEKAAVRGGPELEGLGDFLLGNAAFARAERAKAESALREADPTALARAIAHAATARDAWQRAAASRADWPEARRNVERALLALDDLRKKKEEAEKNRQSKKEQPPEPPPPPPRPDEEIEQDPTAQPDPGELSAAQIAQLLARLDAKEREKRDLRRARQRVRDVAVERDW
jgi:hypothetical protein